jgi:hypothetical protein
MLAVSRMPIQSAILTADRYPVDPAQQVRVSVAYYDGWGRSLQSVLKTPAGPAWQRDSQGEIVVDANGQPVTVQASTRWAVSGRIEYDNKGQAVRGYQPYYINDWRYVADKAMRACGFADTHFHDALGREIQVLTAKGYLRRSGFFPWFTVTEDENNTPVTPPSAPVASVALSVDPDQAPADGTTAMTGTATVTLSDNSLAPDGTQVTFTASNGATPAPVQGSTVNGQAQTAITSTTIGDSIVTATAGGITSNPVTVHFTPSADGGGVESVSVLSLIVTHTLRDDGNDGGDAGGTSEPGGDGQGDGDGDGNEGGQGGGGDVGDISVQPPPLTAQAAADGTATIEVTAVLTGTNNQTVADGTMVTFTADNDGNVSGTTTVDTPQVPSSNGQARTTVRSTEKGWRTVHAAAGGKTGKTQLYFGSGCKVSNIILNVFPNGEQAGGLGTDKVYANVFVGQSPAPQGVQVKLWQVLGLDLQFANDIAVTNDQGVASWDVQCGNAGNFLVQATADNGVQALLPATVSFTD